MNDVVFYIDCHNKTTVQASKNEITIVIKLYHNKKIQSMHILI